MVNIWPWVTKVHLIKNMQLFYVIQSTFPRGNSWKGNRILLSLGWILMQTILAAIFFDFFWQIFFSLQFLLSTKEYVFALRNILLLHKLKKEDDSASYLQQLLKPNPMILTILIDQLQRGKVASVSRNIVHLFVSKLSFPQAQQNLVPLYTF